LSVLERQGQGAGPAHLVQVHGYLEFPVGQPPGHRLGLRTTGNGASGLVGAGCQAREGRGDGPSVGVGVHGGGDVHAQRRRPRDGLAKLAPRDRYRRRGVPDGGHDDRRYVEPGGDEAGDVHRILGRRPDPVAADRERIGDLVAPESSHRGGPALQRHLDIGRHGLAASHTGGQDLEVSWVRGLPGPRATSTGGGPAGQAGVAHALHAKGERFAQQAQVVAIVEGDPGGGGRYRNLPELADESAGAR
jgi:hypothetical protein